MNTSRKYLIVAFVFLAGCADATSPARLSPPLPGPRMSASCDPLTAVIPCPDEMPLGPVTWSFFAPQGDVVYEAPNDPSPGSPGVWLGANISPATCFNDQNLSITDADHDWLDDGCELELARGFAPRWSMGEQDYCPDGEPTWAAKYFPVPSAVRIAFMPAYYDDCGDTDSHPGDSEFVMVEVGFNYTTQHWEFRGMWLSAHYEARVYNVSWDRSDWVSVSDANFSRRPLGHPYVAVSAGKHANYKSEQTCNKTVVNQLGNGEWCWGSVTSPFRFPIDPSRNVGSRFQPLGCLGSTKRFAGNGRTECFYSENKRFAGWHTGAAGETGYWELLRGDKFEVRFGDPGPGPNAYTPPLPPGEDPPPVGPCPDPTQLICG